MRILIIGCGYVGLPLGARLSRAGHEVLGIRRNSASSTELLQLGIQLIQADISAPETLPALSKFDVVVNLVSSSKGGLHEYQSVYLQGTRNLLRWLAPNPPQAYLYTSSTSVYGQTDGLWVTETSPAAPDSATSRILVETERELLRAHQETNLPAMILRVAGIYGPERGHLFQQYLRGEAVLRDSGDSWINMVHVEDVVGSVERLMQSGRPGQIYNIVDDEPVQQVDFFRWLSEKLVKPMPPFALADPNRKRGVTNKRVSNAKLTSETGYQFRFPTFREGYLQEMQRLGLRDRLQ